MKKIILATSLIIGVMLAVSCASPPKVVDAPEEPPAPPPPPPHVTVAAPTSELDLTGAVKYKVKWGDTMVKISRRFYRDGFYYPVIILASQDVVIKNPDKIWPGMVLTVPDLERNKASDNGRNAIKNCLIGTADIERNKARPRRGLINGLRRRADAL